MMEVEDNRAIGVFDSGLGGLTVVKCMKKIMPNERFVYFGDTARTPYGSKDIHTIRKFAIQITDFLTEYNVKAIVIACNTVSAICTDLLQQRYPNIPVIGIIKPTAERIALKYDKGERIGVIGTKVTIESKAYENGILNHNKNLKVESVPCPLFVPAIEEGIKSTNLMDEIIKFYLDDFINGKGIETLVLGCTHYPLIEKKIKKIYSGVNVVNPSEIVAMEVFERLKNNMNKSEKNNESYFFASDLSKGFLEMIHSIMPNEEKVIKLKNFEEHRQQ